MVYSLSENATLVIRSTQSEGIESSICPQEAPTLIVVGIQRYLQDTRFFEQIGLLEEEEPLTTDENKGTPTTRTSPLASHSYYDSSTTILQQVADWKTPAYDLLLSDGTYLLKCLLSPLLNGLVQYGWLTLFTCIRLEKYEWRRNEWRIPITTFLVVHQLSVLQVGPLVERSKLIFPENADPCEKRLQQPLAGKRLHYLALNTEDCVPVDPSVRREDIVVDSQLFGQSSPLSLSKVVSMHENRKVVASVPLMARVVKKFSCSHFGRRDSNQKFPIKFELQISDYHMVAQVICWHTLYFRYFDSIHLDDIVVLEGYRIRKRDDSVEILLNPINPQGKIYILNQKQALNRNIRQNYPPIW